MVDKLESTEAVREALKGFKSPDFDPAARHYGPELPPCEVTKMGPPLWLLIRNPEDHPGEVWYCRDHERYFLEVEGDIPQRCPDAWSGNKEGKK